MIPLPRIHHLLLHYHKRVHPRLVPLLAEAQRSSVLLALLRSPAATHPMRLLGLGWRPEIFSLSFLGWPGLLLDIRLDKIRGGCHWLLMAGLGG
jgi:hypothetical protein